MAGGFSVSIGSDTRLFEQGVKTGVIEPVEDAQDALQDLARSADKAGSGQGLDRLGKSGRDAADDIKTGAKQADQALEQLGRSGKDAGDDVEAGTRQADRALDKLGDTGKDAGRDIESGLKDADRALERVGDAVKDAGNDLEAGLKDAQKQTGKTTAEYKEMAERIRAETAKIKASSKEAFDGAGSSTGEFKDEALSNFSEVTSSFTGDMQSVTDLAQGTFGGLASIGGPAALAFGGIAVAVGLIGSALTAASEESEEFQQKIRDLAQTKLDDILSDFGDSGDKLSQGLRKWASDADSYGGSLTDLRKDAKDAKLSFGDLADAIATDNIPKMRQLRKATEDQIDTLRRQAASLSDGTAKGRIAADTAREHADAAARVKKQLDQNLGVYDVQQDALKALAAAEGETVQQYLAGEEAAARAQEATERFTDAISSQAATMSDTASGTLSNEAANANQYIEIQQHKIDAVQQFASNAGRVYQDVDDQTRQYLQSQGTSMSEEYATYLAATPDQQARLRDQWTVQAKIEADPTDIDKATAEQGKKTTKGPTSELKGDTKDVDKKADAQAKKKGEGPTVKLRPDDSAVDSKLTALRDRVIAGPTVRLRVDGSALDSYLARPRTITVNVRQGQEVK